MKPGKFRYLPHTADVAFEAYGKSFGRALENSAHAMLNVMFDIPKINREKGKIRTLRIAEKARDREELVWFTLQKIVSKVDEKGANAFRFKVNGISQKKNLISVHGCIFYKKLGEYVALLDIKGVTPHELHVKKSPQGYAIRVLVDV